MIKMLIEMDEEKIEREDKYDLNKINTYLKELFARIDSFKDEEGLYTNGTFESFGAIVWRLSEQDWFLNNVKRWIWYTNEGNGDPNTFKYEDIRKQYVAA